MWLEFFKVLYKIQNISIRNSWLLMNASSLNWPPALNDFISVSLNLI